MAKKPFSTVDGEVHFVQWFRDIVYSFDGKETDPWIQIDVHKEAIPDNVLKSTADGYSGNFMRTVYGILNEGKYSVGLRNLYETDRFIFCEFLLSSPASSLLIVDKKTDRSIYIADHSKVFSGFNNIIHSENNTLISLWDDNYIQRLSESIDRNANAFEPEVIDLVRSYNPLEDNPVLLLSAMKK
jgi:hypothetical protein